ncbi:ArsR/SmtB family transcription factor [Herbiconiux solani]|uniref:ArsR/SmtB family transcription factor n=1 Tax=Herbiconiux solani TaxID=661329 RepID=UPI0008245D57|nr:metalloregulator ArsR/SmtB family transcription factor [Herbiconiux solani]
MVTRLSDDETDAVFRALADPTRRDILRRAIRQEQSISALAERYEMSFAAVQKHVAVLERAAIIEKQRRGKEQIVRARLETLARATELLGEFEALWRERTLRIEELLADPADPASETTPTRPTEKGHP